MVADAGMTDVGRIETGREPFKTLEKFGSVTNWDQEQIDVAFGGVVKRVSKL